MWRIFRSVSDAPESGALMCAMLLPFCYVLLMLGAWALRKVLFAWRGDPVIALLLKLFEEVDVDRNRG